MARVQHKPLTFDTFEDFLEWERLQATRHDLIDGVPVAMAGASEGHNVIQVNILAALLGRLKGGGCRPFLSDMAVKTGFRKGRYPDVTVDCGPRNPENRSLPCPTVIFEVLSTDTRSEDWTVKLWEYNDVRTIAHYVLVEQSTPLVHIYSRHGDGDFKLRPQEVGGLESIVELPGIGVSLPVAEVYDSLEFDAEPTPDAPPPTRTPWHP